MVYKGTHRCSYPPKNRMMYMSNSGRHDNQLTQLMDSWVHGEGQQERGSNLWRAFSSVTDWADNSEANEKDREKASHIIGTRAMQKTRAFDLAYAIASKNV